MARTHGLAGLVGVLFTGMSLLTIGCDDTNDGAGGATSSSTSSSSSSSSSSGTSSSSTASSSSSSTSTSGSTSSGGPVCDASSCSGHGACDDTTGVPVCDCDPHFVGATCDACDTGYTGAGCDTCDAGFFEFPAASSTCVDDPCLPDVCNGNGACSNDAGAAVCACTGHATGTFCETCDSGYAGADCTACDAGYVEYPAGSGTCVDDPCLPDVCNGHGACASGTGAAVCTCTGHFVGAACDQCDAGYTGAACDQCASGYVEFPAGSGTCIDDPCVPDVCNGHGTCSSATGVAACTCSAGYAESTCNQCVRYVDVAATGTGTGTTWANAFTTVQAGINAANTAIGAGAATCEVWVRAGTYYGYTTSNANTITLRSKVALRGGFAGTETERASADPSAHVTTLSARKSAVDATSVSTVITMNGISSATVDGFTVRDAIATLVDGGGIRATNSTSTVSRCTFENNVASSGKGAGAIFAGGTTPTHTMTVTDSTFTNNSADGAGGAVTLAGGEYALSNLTFTSNTSGMQGGGIYVFSANVSLSGATFTDNRAVDGGAIAFRKPGTVPPTFTNVELSRNHASGGGGGFYTDWADTGTFTNVALVGNGAGTGGAAFLFGQAGLTFNGCTVTGNWASSSGQAIFWNTTAPTLQNSIVWGNPNLVGAAAVELRPANGTITVATTLYSDVRNYTLGTGSIDADPQFQSMPAFFDWTTGAGTTTSVTVKSGLIYAAGDVIEIDDDGVARTVTTSDATSVTFTPALSTASAAERQIRNWGASLDGVSVMLDVGSPCVDAADAATAPTTDLNGNARVGAPDMGSLESQ